MANQSTTGAELAAVEEQAPTPFVRVVADGGFSKDARVELVDGRAVTPLPLVRKATLYLEAGQPNRADLELLLVEGNATAEHVRLREIALPPERGEKLVVVVHAGRRRWYGLRRSLVELQRWRPAADGYVVSAELAWSGPAMLPRTYTVGDQL